MEIDELILKFLSNECSKDEKVLLKNLLADNEGNRELLENYSKIWLSASQYGNINNQETNIAWESLNKKIAKGASIKHKPTTIYSLMRIAATWTLLMGIGAMLFYLINTGSQVSQAFKICQITTPLGSRANITLPDGTEVWLNAGTILTYPEIFSSAQRDVSLTGEAFFKVKTNKERPFVVHAADVKIKALGTTFNVKAYPTDKSVVATLVEGVIKFESSDSSKQSFTYTLQPKTKVTYSKNTTQPVNKTVVTEKEPMPAIPETSVNTGIDITENTNTVLATSWKDPRWVIEGEPLNNLAVMLERRFDVKINLLSTELDNYTFTGTIENETLEQVLNYLKLSNPIKYTIKKGQVDLMINEPLKTKYTNYLKTYNKKL